MRRWARACLLPALLTGAVAWVQAAEPAPPEAQAERLRITAERARVAERVAADQRACHQRFAVNDCLKASRTWERGVLDDLRRREVQLNDEERQRKAHAQQHKLEGKQELHEQDAAGRPVAPPPAVRGLPEPAAGKLPRAAAPRGPDKQQIEQHEATMRNKQASHAADEARRAAKAARAGEQAELTAERQREAAQHKAQVLERNARKASTAKPLPAP